MITENLSTLKIHKLTQEQYDRELANGNLDENAFYLTPDEGIDLNGYATVEQLNDKANSDHTHTIADVSDLQTTLDTMSLAVDAKANSTHEHDITDITNLESALSANLDAAKQYTTDEITTLSSSIADKVQVADDIAAAKQEAIDTANAFTTEEIQKVALNTDAIDALDSRMTTAEDEIVAFHTAIDEVNTELDGSIKALSAYGNTITYTKNDGTTETITTQDTNDKVKNVLNTTIKAYVTGTPNATTSTAFQVFDTDIYIDTTAGQLVATTFKGNLDGIAKQAISDASGNSIKGTYETKADANTKLEEAKVYTETKFNAASLDATTKANNAVVIANTHIETALEEAKTYADSAASNMKEEAINTAAADATTKANNARTEAMEWINTLYDTLKKHAEDYAKDYAEDYADSKLTEAKTYTDNVVASKANTSHNHTISDITDAVGKSLQGQDIYVGLEDTYANGTPAGTGAEIFNDYRDRTGNDLHTNPTPDSVNTGNVATGEYSHAEGVGTTATGNYSHAEGCKTWARNESSHAEGRYTEANGECSHAEGCETWTFGYCSHAEGFGTDAHGAYSHAEGSNTEANGSSSHAEGSDTVANGVCSHAAGSRTTALDYQYVIGHHNDTKTAGTYSGTTGDAFIIGKGTASSASNAFRVSYAGKAYVATSGVSTGADYAEFFEWLDSNPNNEDRRGYFVTLDGEKIKIAEPDDYILGIVSGMPCIIGNGDECWRGRYVQDEFGAFITEEFEYEEEIREKIIDEETGKVTYETKMVTKTGTTYKENPDYDPTATYVQREDRPEWDTVGMLGVLSVRDDGTCKVNGFCKVAKGGTATASDSGYRVISRVNENIVKVVFK